MWISVDRHRVVTARRQPLRSIDQLRTSAKRGEVMASPPDLLEHLLHAQADVPAWRGRRADITGLGVLP